MTKLSEDAPVEGTSVVEIRQAVLDDLVAHARLEAPHECCGILVGSAGRIEQSQRARNLLRSTTRYLIDPKDQFAAMRSARELGLAVVGFYHSHPVSVPEPSTSDTDGAAYPGHWYLIVFPGDRGVPAEVRGFVLHESGNFRAVKLVPTP